MRDIERGVGGLYLVELKDICTVLKIGLGGFVQEFEQALPGRRKRN